MHDASPSGHQPTVKALVARSLAVVVLAGIVLAWVESAPAWKMERAHYGLFGWAALGVWWLSAAKRCVVAMLRPSNEPTAQAKGEE